MRNKQASPVVNVVCGVIFLVFTFMYLFCFQDDLLYYAQHVLSEGTTEYNPFVGAVAITAVLGIINMVSSRLIANNFYSLPALYYLPSMLLLASITDVHIVKNGTKDIFGSVWIVAIILFIILLIANRMMRSFILVPLRSKECQLKNNTLNMAVMIGMMVYVLASGNTNELDHVTLREEMLIKQGRYEDAALLAKPQNLSSRHLTTLRAFALGKTGWIGEHFFEYPVIGTSKDLQPSKDNPMLFTSAQPIYSIAGSKDYHYLACLIDRDLDGFVANLLKDTVNVTSLPKHYLEALVLYKHLRTNPRIVISKPEMEADFSDFDALIKKNPNKVLRDNALRDSYGNTYWYYYFK